MKRVGNFPASGFDGSYDVICCTPQKLMMKHEGSKYLGISMDGITTYYDYIGIFLSPILSFQRLQSGGTDPQDGAASHSRRWTRSGCGGRGTEWGFNGIHFKDHIGVSTWEMINNATCTRIGIGLQSLLQHDCHTFIMIVHMLLIRYHNCSSTQFHIHHPIPQAAIC